MLTVKDGQKGQRLGDLKIGSWFREGGRIGLKLQNWSELSVLVLTCNSTSTDFSIVTVSADTMCSQIANPKITLEVD